MTPATFNFLIDLIENNIIGDVEFRDTHYQDIPVIINACISGWFQHNERELKHGL